MTNKEEKDVEEVQPVMEHKERQTAWKYQTFSAQQVFVDILFGFSNLLILKQIWK